MVDNSNILITGSTFCNIIRNVLNKVLTRRQVPLADWIYEFEEIESLSNHPNKEVSIAMEIIIQFGNLYEDGIYDISPRMYDYLKLALQTLQNKQEKNRQIESLIRVGTQYLKTFNVL